MTAQEMRMKAEKLHFFREIQKDIPLYVDMLESLRQEDAVILHDSGQALLLQLKSWPLYLLAAADPEEGERLLAGMTPDENGLVAVVLHGKELFSRAEVLGFTESTPCYQTLYDKNDLLPLHTELAIRHPDRTDYETICKAYTLPIGEDEIYASIDRPEFSAGYLGDLLAGFIGLHAEGSIGMLHVFEAFRGRGYALDLAAHMINRRMADGAFPYGQVFIDNDASIALQKKMGLSFSGDYICWKFKKESSTK